MVQFEATSKINYRIRLKLHYIIPYNHKKRLIILKNMVKTQQTFLLH